MKKESTHKIFLVISLILIALLVYLIVLTVRKSSEDEYTAVYLNTGDLYFGKVVQFPKFGLKDVWFLQTQTDQTGQVNFTLIKFTDAVYLPEDRLEINKDNVIWMTKLDKNSPVIQEIKNSRLNNTPNTQAPASQAPQAQQVPQTQSPQVEGGQAPLINQGGEGLINNQ